MNETKYLVVLDYVSGISTIVPLIQIDPDDNPDFDYEQYIQNDETISDNYDWFIGTLNFK